MQKISIFIFLFLTGFTAAAQVQTFWTENFNNGCTTNCTASSYTGVNGAWTVTDVTPPGNVANDWFVSCAENGQAVGACGAGCGNNATLHVANVPCTLCLACPSGDCGAAYNAGPSFGGENPKSDKRAASPVINAAAYSNIILSFKYMERGQNTTDDATVEYSLNGGTTWNLLTNTAKTATSCGSGQGLWTAFTDTLPATCNNAATLQIGFHWKNNADGVGGDPSFAVDDVQLSMDVTGLPEMITQNSFDLSYNAATHKVKIILDNQLKNFNFQIVDITGRKVSEKSFMDAHNLTEFIYDASSLPHGIYFARLTAGNAVVTRKLIIP